MNALRTVLSELARATLTHLAPLLPPPRIIRDRAGNEPYLSRWYLTGRPRMPDGSNGITADGQIARGALPAPPMALYLHQFHQSDDCGSLHNHPFAWSFSLILAGGYHEEITLGRRIVRRTLHPFSLNYIRHDTHHRVDLLEHDAWTLFLAGPKVASWGFADRTTGAYTAWRDFLAANRGVRPS